MQRPRLHVNGCIMHGLAVVVMVSRADFPTTTNVTCKIIAHMLTRARKRGIDLRRGLSRKLKPISFGRGTRTKTST
eukprot:4074228-Heterocapsa_arctica.AAC.1